MSIDEKYPFYSVKSQINDFYAIDLNDDDFETMGISGWRRIGNYDTRTYKYKGHVIDHKLELPCNCDILESVNYLYEDFHHTDNLTPGNFSFSPIEEMITNLQFEHDDLWQRGKYANYHRIGNTLEFYLTNIPVNVIYRGVLVDKEGLPMLSFREVEAIACYCAWIQTRKMGMATRDKATIEVSMMLQKEWGKRCANARVPEHINQTEMDRILDAQTSWDRKRFGKSFKPVK
jgi:hypothetical protein